MLYSTIRLGGLTGSDSRPGRCHNGCSAAWRKLACRQSASRHGTIPGVGPVTSLAFISTIDVPARFKSSKAIGPSLGLTAVLNQSGESHRIGRISLCGDQAMRALLCEAAQVMLTRVQKWSWLKAWAMQIAERRGQQKAIVALTRRLAVIMHRIWSDGTEFRWTRKVSIAGQ
ncbi:transposase [Bradyrhizobium sp. SBR1B]|nr:transposase [Bradyrhizobium sp. SBR1B]